MPDLSGMGKAGEIPLGACPPSVTRYTIDEISLKDSGTSGEEALRRWSQGSRDASRPAILRCLMGLINDILEDSLPAVVVGAVATAILMPLVGGRTAAAAGTNGAASGGRRNPLLKAAVKGYVTVADRLKEATAEAREQFSDLAAEVREEQRLQAEEAQSEMNPEPAAQRAAPRANRSKRRRSKAG
jgi:hypothetical protein